MSLDFLKDTKEFRKFLQELKKGQKNFKISGLVEPAKAYFLATLAQESEKGIVYINTSSSSLSRFQEQCQFFFG